MEEQLDSFLEQGRIEEACEKLRDAVKRIKDSAKTQPFVMTPEFCQVPSEM